MHPFFPSSTLRRTGLAAAALALAGRLCGTARAQTPVCAKPWWP